MSRALVRLVFWVCLACSCATAQPGGAGLLPSAETLTVDVPLVDVFFVVKDGKKLVHNATVDDIRVFEDGREQKIAYFSPASEQPLQIVLMLDTSGSQTRIFHREVVVASEFLGKLLRERDEAMIVTFDSGIAVEQEFTGNRRLLSDALAEVRLAGAARKRQIESAPIPRNRSTALYDAMVQVSELRLRQRAGRKVLVLLTDGQDMGSRHTAREAVDAAARADAICYVLLIGDNRFTHAKDYVGKNRMRELARHTGGQLIKLGDDTEKLEASFQAIAEEVRAQYSIAYTPTERRQYGAFRRIELRARQGWKVQGRKGYFAAPRVMHASR